MATKTRKKASRSRRKAGKKPRRTIKVTEDGLGLGPVRPAGKEKYRGTGFRGTKYQAVLDKINTLKKGESFPLTPPKGTTAAQLHSRLGVIVDRAVRLGQVKVPDGCKIRKRTLAGSETIEIALVAA